MDFNCQSVRHLRVSKIVSSVVIYGKHDSLVSLSSGSVLVRVMIFDLQIFALPGALCNGRHGGGGGDRSPGPKHIAYTRVQEATLDDICIGESARFSATKRMRKRLRHSG